MRALRITVFIAGAILILTVILALFQNRDSGSPAPIQNSTVTSGETGNTNTSEETPAIPAESNVNRSVADDTTRIRTYAGIFSERFESYHENNREAVLPSIAPYVTGGNYDRLAKDAARIAAQADVPDPKTHTAHAVAMTVQSKTEQRASVDVLLRVEIHGGIPLTVLETISKTIRLIMVKDGDMWKVENATF